MGRPRHAQMSRIKVLLARFHTGKTRPEPSGGGEVGGGWSWATLLLCTVQIKSSDFATAFDPYMLVRESAWLLWVHLDVMVPQLNENKRWFCENTVGTWVQCPDTCQSSRPAAMVPVAKHPSSRLVRSASICGCVVFSVLHLFHFM